MLVIISSLNINKYIYYMSIYWAKLNELISNKYYWSERSACTSGGNLGKHCKTGTIPPTPHINMCDCIALLIQTRGDDWPKN